MPTNASAALRAAVHDALVADGGLISVLGGPKVYDEPPRAAAFPYVTYEDGIWRDGISLTMHGGRVTLRAKEEELVLAGAFVETTDTAYIPDRAIVLGVSSRTTLAITGANSYGVGILGNTTQFGNLLGVALNSTNNGVIGPTAFYADTKVRVTANGGNFTAGKVRLIAYFLEMSVPNS